MDRNGRDGIKVEKGYGSEEDHDHKNKDKKGEQKEELSVERIFENQEVPSWRNQLTLRPLRFLGLFSVVPLRKVMIIDYKLTYPSGTATAYLINSFHTPAGAKLAKFFFDFSATYVGVGMICPYIINISVLLGGILSWGLMWPLIDTKKGDWISYDDQRRTQLFLKDQIPTWFAVAGYVAIAAVSTATLPHIFPELKWYYILVIYIFAPGLAFCNAYGCGLTDWSLASAYGKLAIFVIGAWVGAAHGGVLAGLAACGVMMNITSTASDLSQDFRLLLTFFATAFKDLGIPGSQYPAPNATVFRNMAILGTDGFSSLPKNCLYLCYGFFGAAILINLIKDTLGKKWARFIPNPMAMAIPFYIGSYFAIDMCVGSLILFIWEKIDKAKADAFGPAVASGLICGDGIWTLPGAILALAGVKPPICMKFLSRGTNARVDEFLGS
uniref:Uncharacterized protein n=1 Tax=Salix viminalis TaxID=40686 RepID=A0A6N2LLI7_SALVM